MKDEGEVLIGRWDCASCGSRGVRGDEYRCGNCGAGRPEGVRFYLTKDAEVVRDEEGLRAAKAGADWKCDYCSQWVAATLASCPSCAGGAIQGAARQRFGSTVQVERAPERHDNEGDVGRREAGDRPRQPRPTGTASPARTARSAAPTSLPTVPSRNVAMKALVALVAVALFAGFCALASALMRSETVSATIAGHSWRRVQSVEELRTLDEEGWTKPGDAYSVREESRVHHHDKVLDHYETRWRTVHERVPDGTERVKTGTRTVDLGNGRFRREPVYTTRTRYKTVERRESYREPVYRRVPVHRTWYVYKVDRWVAGKPVVAEGVGLEPSWPHVDVTAKLRLTTRSEQYTLRLTEKNPKTADQPRSWEHSLDEATWRSMPDGAAVVLEVGLGGVRSLKTPEDASRSSR